MSPRAKAGKKRIEKAGFASQLHRDYSEAKEAARVASLALTEARTTAREKLTAALNALYIHQTESTRLASVLRSHEQALGELCSLVTPQATADGGLLVQVPLTAISQRAVGIAETRLAVEQQALQLGAHSGDLERLLETWKVPASEGTGVGDGCEAD